MNYLDTNSKIYNPPYIKKCNYSYKIHSDTLNKKNQTSKPTPKVFKWCQCHINKSNRNMILDEKCRCN